MRASLGTAAVYKKHKQAGQGHCERGGGIFETSPPVRRTPASLLGRKRKKSMWPNRVACIDPERAPLPDSGI